MDTFPVIVAVAVVPAGAFVSARLTAHFLKAPFLCGRCEVSRVKYRDEQCTPCERMVAEAVRQAESEGRSLPDPLAPYFR